MRRLCKKTLIRPGALCQAGRFCGAHAFFQQRFLVLSRLLIVFAALLLAISPFSAQGEGEIVYRESSYPAYAQRHAGMEKPLEEIAIDVLSGVPGEDSQCSIQAVDGREAYVWSEGRGEVSWTFHVETAGLYALEVTYYALESNSSLLELSVSLDGELPFTEAEQLQLTRLYRDETTAYAHDTIGNDIRPRQLEIFDWQAKTFHDVDGYINGSYLFALEAGKHVLTIQGIRAPVAIGGIRFYNAEQPISYAEYAQGVSAAASPDISCVVIEAEHAFTKTSLQLYPICDRSDPKTSPSDPIAKKLNSIGGENWSNSDQSITWEFDVPEDGFYKIAFRYLQNYLRGMMVYRQIEIDGEILFSEMDQMPFPYGVSWQCKTLGDTEPCAIYLTKGRHTITLTPTTGELARLMANVDSIVSSLNMLYRRIIMITGTSPDMYRDYFLQESIPGMIDTMRALAAGLRSTEAEVRQITGNSGTEAASLLRMAEQLESFCEKPNTIPTRLTTFRDNIISLSTWVLTVSKQSLLLDTLYICPIDQELPDMQASFGETLAYQGEALIGSFTTDYETVGNAGEGDRVITVWISSGRDQAEVLKELIDSSFSQETGIGVNLSIMQSGLMQAVMAGIGPDVVIMVGHGDPVNYALRGALLPLENFDGFDEVISGYMPTAMEPYAWNGHYWGLPNTQNFYMMFYRTDIFEELGLSAPETWDDMLLAAEVLQRNNMNIGLPYTSLDAYASVSTGIGGATLFPTLLLQNEVGLYTDDRLHTTLSTPGALEAFKQWTAFYTQYGFPLYKDDFNRFRTGEMPLVITSYTFYNQLKIAAPDIRNLWEMALIPGTKQADGTVNHATAAFGTAGMIFSTTKLPEEAWAFLRWWNEEETQTEYGRQIENILGAAGRYNPANVESMKTMPWSGDEVELILSQWEWVQELPELPGSYYVSRNIDNAFKEVYYQNGNCRETLNYWTRQIEAELERKRIEFAPAAGEGE